MRRSVVFRLPLITICLLTAATFLIPAKLRAAEAAIATATVPAVAAVHGYGGVEWRTDVALRNDGAADVDVVLSLPAVAGQPFFLTTLSGGQSVVLADLVRETFGQVETISPLLVQTLAQRSVTVSAAIYPVTGGQLGSPEFLPTYYGGIGSGESQMSMLRLGDDYRTNIGFVNLGESDARFTVALRRLEGRNLAVMTLSVPAGGLIQIPLQLLFPLITEGNDFAVIADCGSDQTLAYASVIRNDTNEALFAQPLRPRYGPR
jgi:hypothetical protein